MSNTNDLVLFEVGKGEMVVNWGEYEGRSCVFVRSAENPGPVGESCGDKEPSSPDCLLPGEKIIFCKDEGHAELIYNALRGVSIQHSSASPAVPENLGNKVRAADRAEHPTVKEVLISEAVEILDQLAAPTTANPEESK